MNRSFISVIAGGFGTDGSLLAMIRKWVSTAKSPQKRQRTAEKLPFSDHYSGVRHGSREAQYPVAEITEKLRARGINVVSVSTRSRGVCLDI